MKKYKHGIDNLYTKYYETKDNNILDSLREEMSLFLYYVSRNNSDIGSQFHIAEIVETTIFKIIEKILKTKNSFVTTKFTAYLLKTFYNTKIHYLKNKTNVLDSIDDENFHFEIEDSSTLKKITEIESNIDIKLILKKIRLKLVELTAPRHIKTNVLIYTLLHKNIDFLRNLPTTTQIEFNLLREDLLNEWRKFT